MANLQQVHERYQRRNDPSLPDKCDCCALQVNYVADSEFDARTQKVVELDKLGLAKYTPRKIRLSTTLVQPDSFCAIGNTRWSQKHIPCKDWQLRMPSGTTTIADSISIHHTNVSSRIATRWQIIAIVLGVIGLFLTGIGIWMAHNDSTISVVQTNPK